MNKARYDNFPVFICCPVKFLYIIIPWSCDHIPTTLVLFAPEQDGVNETIS